MPRRKVLKLKCLSKHSPKKQNVLNLDVLVTKMWFLRDKCTLLLSACDAALVQCNHISSHPAGSLFTSNRDARGSLGGRTRKKEQVCFPSLWALPQPHPFAQAVTVSFSGLPWFQFVVFPTLPEPVSESPACSRWSLLRGLIPPLSLKLWQFQPLLFVSPAWD